MWRKLLAFVLILLLLVVFRVYKVATAPDMERFTKTVRYGDTIYGYAKIYAPNIDTREYLDKVKEINKMPNGMIYAGDKIILLKEEEK